MNNWTLYFLEINLYLCLVGLSYEFLFKTSQNFKFGRPFLTIGCVFSLSIPLIDWSFFNGIGQSLNNEIYWLEPILIQGKQLISTHSQDIFIWIIGLGALISLLSSCTDVARLKVLSRNAEKKGSYYLLKNSYSAFSFFKQIYIGDQIPNEKRAIILQHEKVHIEQWHSLDRILMQLLRGMFWYNPIFYLIQSNLEELHEFEADQQSTTEQTNYIDLLLQQEFKNFHFSIINPFNSKHLKNRIMRIKKNKNGKQIKKSSLVTFLLLLSSSIIIGQSLLRNNLSDLALNGKSESIAIGDLKEAQFPGGMDALIKYMIEHIKYPKQEEKNGTEGTVFIEFKIDETGKCSDFKVKKGINTVLDQAALDGMKQMPEWIPATKDGKKVSSLMVLPVKFALSKEKR